MTPAQFIARFNLQGKTVLETGCADGRQTVELIFAGGVVLGVDCREENLLRTSEVVSAAGGAIEAGDVRHGWDLRLADLETYTFPDVDACWHSGTLYHLTKPVEHLHRNLPKIRHALYLSTHYSPGHKIHWHRESVGPRAGLSNKSLWLPLNQIQEIIAQYFPHTELLDNRQERHGWRAELVAWK